MLIDEIVDFCDTKYRNSKCNRCDNCSYGDNCPGSCEVQGAAKGVYIIFIRLLRHLHQENMTVATWLVITLANIHINICPNLLMRFRI